MEHDSTIRAGERPNVLVICVDHWPGPLLGAAGHKHILTDTLNFLCENGIRFTQAYSTTPTCIPARRALMTGTTARTHGDRIFNTQLRMPGDLPTVAETFTRNGYQAYAVGKMHVNPSRDRMGFGDILLLEEGREYSDGSRDDYEVFLEEEGYAGQAFMHGSGNNRYNARPWNLPEQCHPTYWVTKNICRALQRRDPTKPGFFYASYIGPHPPITPPKDYWDMYAHTDIDEPVYGEWSKDPDNLPPISRDRASSAYIKQAEYMGKRQIDLARKAFYAQCSYIDQMLGTVIGTLREEGMLDNTIIMFTADHGDMLGNHHLLEKSFFYEYSCKVPMILSVPEHLKDCKCGTTDDRLVALRDVMPTLLDLCGIDIPDSVEGCSMLSDQKRDYLYGEHWEGREATRMIRKGAYKLIYYASGNIFQLFNIDDDPMERDDLYPAERETETVRELKGLLVSSLYGDDLKWLKDGELVGLPLEKNAYVPQRGLLYQRGLH